MKSNDRYSRIVRAEGILQRKYLMWDNWCITRRDQLLPVVKLPEKRDEPCIEYYSSTGLEPESLIYSEPIGDDEVAEDIVYRVEQRLKDTSWFLYPMVYVKDREFAVSGPIASIHLKGEASRAVTYFDVDADETGFPENRPVEVVSLEIRVEPQKHRDDCFYNLQFGNDGQNLPDVTFITHELEDSLVVEARDNEWVQLIGCFREAGTGFTSDGRGIRFPLINEEVWLKAIIARAESKTDTLLKDFFI